MTRSKLMTNLKIFLNKKKARKSWQTMRAKCITNIRSKIMEQIKQSQLSEAGRSILKTAYEDGFFSYYKNSLQVKSNVINYSVMTLIRLRLVKVHYNGVDFLLTQEGKEVASEILISEAVRETEAKHV